MENFVILWAIFSFHQSLYVGQHSKMNYMFEHSLPVRLELSWSFFLYFQSEQEMEKLMSESPEKVSTHVVLTSWGFLTLYFISPDFSYCFIHMATFIIACTRTPLYVCIICCLQIAILSVCVILARLIPVFFLSG